MYPFLRRRPEQLERPTRNAEPEAVYDTGALSYAILHIPMLIQLPDQPSSSGPEKKD